MFSRLKNSLQSTAGLLTSNLASALGGAAVTVVVTSELQKRDKDQDFKTSMHNHYQEQCAPLVRRAHEICKQTTGSRCANAAEYASFAIHWSDASTPDDRWRAGAVNVKKPFETSAALEVNSLRTTLIRYWSHYLEGLAVDQGCFKRGAPMNPAIGEMKDFATFVRAVYYANNTQPWADQRDAVRGSAGNKFDRVTHKIQDTERRSKVLATQRECDEILMKELERRRKILGLSATLAESK